MIAKGRQVTSMGAVPTIGHDRFPRQGHLIGHRVSVCFASEPDRTTGGVMVRQDDELPYVEIIRLDDGRLVLTAECLWMPVR